MGEVVQFPKAKLNTPPQNMDEMVSSIEQSRREYIESFLDTYMPILFQRAYDDGFDLTEEKCNYINSLFVEAFRAALLMSVDIEHELQNFAEESMKMYEESLKQTDDGEKDT